MTYDIIEMWLSTHLMILDNHAYFLMIEFSFAMFLAITFGIFGLPIRILFAKKNKNEEQTV